MPGTSVRQKTTSKIPSFKINITHHYAHPFCFPSASFRWHSNFGVDFPLVETHMFLAIQLSEMLAWHNDNFVYSESWWS